MQAGAKQYALWDDFLKEWPVERLGTMTLEEYARAGDDKSFIRWIESHLSEMGSIWGGSGFKFGIYGRAAEEQKEAKAGRSYSNEYGWYTKYGTTADEAFKKVRGLVADTAAAARAGNLEVIDAVDLGDAFKWKIAFHYQNREKPLITGVFSRQHLQIFLGEKPTAWLPYSQLYRRLSDARGGKDLLEFGGHVWEAASKKLEEVFNPDNAELYLESRFQYYGKPTQNLAGFVTPGGHNLAIRRGRTVVRIFVEADAPVVDGVSVVESYKADTPRSSNIPSQAPKLAVGNEAKLIQISTAKSLAEFCDAYDDAPEQISQLPQQTSSPDEATVNSLNLILFGPPGTGKTYETAERAVRICDGKVASDRAALMHRYEELRQEGRIRFVTFHQSYSYEDFVEGLRPEMKDGQVTYRVRPGIFREVCDAARRSQLVRPGIEGKPLSERTLYKMSLGTADTPQGNKVFQECIEKGYVMLGWGEDVDFSQCASPEQMKAKVQEDRPDLLKDGDSHTRYPWILKSEVKVGDIVVVSYGNTAFRAIAEVKGEYEFVESTTFNQARPVRWLGVFEGGRDVKEIYDRNFMMSTLYRLDREGLNLKAIEALLNPGEQVSNQPFVLVIDEINRANISKVVGELITLMEPDKREGAPNALTVKLPYSGDDFSVPSNLFILATMNTADRSIALLDTALRRRFEFIELRPEPATLGTVAGVDLGAMLSAMNRRIEYLYDRDHVIGHAYFMDVSSLENLEAIMRRRVIPLLQEYFYEDWSKVRLVLNDHAGLFIEASQATLDTKIPIDDLEPKTRYQLRAEAFPEQAYLNIYK